jgi:CheY-like chemotaxis protein
VLFEAFKESEEETSSKYAEVGLGLPVSQRLCHLMGGQITVASKLGRGSSFTIRLPAKTKAVAATPSIAAAAADAKPPEGDWKPTVLIVDDDTLALEIARQFVAAEGCVPLVAASVADGLDILATHRPAMILLDVLMPERDGWEMLTALDGDPRIAGCPVIMVTAVEDRERGIALGAAGHIIKPLTQRALHEALRATNVLPEAKAEQATRAKAA